MAMPHAGCSQGRHLNINHIITMIDASNAVPQPHPKHKRFRDLTGQRFGRLEAVFYAGRIKGRAMWFCSCECGNKTLAVSWELLNGHTSSCSCMIREKLIKLSTKHGMSSDGRMAPEIAAYSRMKTRCYNKSRKDYYRYGGRGITVCDRWLHGDGVKDGSVCFLEDMGKRPSQYHSIDRIDNNSGYSPENCRWSTMKEQCSNRGSNIHVTINSETRILSQWAEISGIKYHTLYHRLKKGCPPDMLLI